MNLIHYAGAIEGIQARGDPFLLCEVTCMYQTWKKFSLNTRAIGDNNMMASINIFVQKDGVFCHAHSSMSTQLFIGATTHGIYCPVIKCKNGRLEIAS